MSLRRTITLLCLVAAGLLSGCATVLKMPLSESSDTIPPGSKAIFLMTATLKNSYHDSYQPTLLVLNIEKPDAKEKADRLNFTMDDKARAEADNVMFGNTYYLRMDLPAGDFIIRGLTGMSHKLLTQAMCFAPVHADLKAPATGVFYLGHINATIRERKGEEFRAGPPLPLIDQAVAGFSGGTFDIEITDQMETDMKQFLSRFPALRKVTVQKAILPSFDRERAQKFWKEN